MTQARTDAAPAPRVRPFPFPTGLIQVPALRFLKIAIGALLFGNLVRVPLFLIDLKAAPIVASDLAVGGLALALLIHALRTRQLRIDAVSGLAIGFAAIGGLAAFVSFVRFGLGPVELTVSLAYLVRWILYFGVFVAVLHFVRPAATASVVRLLERVILLFAAFGILQSAFLPGFAQMVHPGEWDEQGMRLVSTFLDPNLAGMFLLVGFCLYLGKMVFGERVASWKLLVIVLALALTLSRSTALGLIAALAVIGMVRGHSRKFVRFALIGGGAVLMFAPALITLAADFGRFQIDGSAAVRFITWTRAFVVFLDNPIIGIGFNTYGFVAERYGFAAQIGSDFSLDGGLLFVLVLTGVMGLVIYLGMIGVTATRCRVLWREASDPAGRGLGLGVLAATVALLVHSLFVNSLLMAHLMATFWLLWGLVAVRAAALRGDSSPGEARGSVAG